MILYINTIKEGAKYIELIIYKGEKILAKFKIKAERRQSEKLLSSIDKILKNNNIKIDNINKIVVANKGEGFTSLRIGVATANALAFALGINIEGESGKVLNRKGLKIIKPKYVKEPNITYNN